MRESSELCLEGGPRLPIGFGVAFDGKLDLPRVIKNVASGDSVTFEVTNRATGAIRGHLTATLEWNKGFAEGFDVSDGRPFGGGSEAWSPDTVERRGVKRIIVVVELEETA